MPGVSVVVPCFGHAHHLAECLESLEVQTEGDWEAVVVDDGSPDGERIEAEVARLDDPRVRLERHADNRGLAAVFERLRHAAPGAAREVAPREERLQRIAGDELAFLGHAPATEVDPQG